MMHLGQLAKRDLDGSVIGVAGYTEHLVQIHHAATFHFARTASNRIRTGHTRRSAYRGATKGTNHVLVCGERGPCRRRCGRDLKIAVIPPRPRKARTRQSAAQVSLCSRQFREAGWQRIGVWRQRRWLRTVKPLDGDRVRAGGLRFRKPRSEGRAVVGDFRRVLTSLLVGALTWWRHVSRLLRRALPQQ